MVNKWQTCATAVVLAAAWCAAADVAFAGPAQREMRVIARRYEFVPRTITVKKGEHVRLSVTAADVDHGIAIREFGIDAIVRANETKVIEFVADKEGRFTIECSVFCGDGHPEMVGELVVTSTARMQSSSAKVTFDNSAPGVVIVETAEERLRIDTSTRSILRLERSEPARQTGNDQREASTQRETSRAYEPYDYQIVNVPTSKPVRRRSLNIHFTHRFQQPFVPVDESADDLFGLDSTAVAAFGFTYGITDRLYAKAYRSPLCRKGLCKTIEMGVGYHWLDEKRRSPISLSTYASIEGDDNFQKNFTYNLQAMMGRSITRYVNLFFSPAVHINSNGQGRFNVHPDESTDPRALGLTLGQHTGSFGFGVNGRIRPSVSLLFEYTPRVGFKMGQIVPVIDEGTQELVAFKNNSEAALGFGVERRIGRHVFSLTFTNTQATTTSRYNSSNAALPPDKFSIGFNIYRRLL